MFPKSEISSINDKISGILGKPKVTENRVGSSVTQTNSWELKERKPFFELLCKPANFPAKGFSTEVIDTAVSALAINAWNTDWLPFYVISVRLDIRASFLDQEMPESFGSKLVKVTHPLRLFVQSLGGLIASVTSMRPVSPMITLVGASISSEGIAQIVEDVSTSARPTPNEAFRGSKAKYHTNLEDLAQFPFDLEYESIIQQRSVVMEASNVLTLYGLSSQLAFYGQWCPYVTILATDENLIDNPIFDMDGMSLPTRTPPGLTPLATWVLTSVIAINGWLQSNKATVSRLEGEASHWRSDTHIDIKGSDKLSSIVKIGLEASAVSSDIGLARRLVLSPLQAWSRGEFSEHQEIPIVGSGVLRYLASDTISILDGLWNNITEIRDETDWLIKHVSTQTTMESNDALIELSSAMARSSQRLFSLTLVLIALTLVIAVLTYFLVFH